VLVLIAIFPTWFGVDSLMEKKRTAA